jgi:periplasmic copper chaperone A
MTRKHLRSLFTAMLLVPAAAIAQHKDAIHIEAPWARASAGMTGAAYLTVKNDGDAADKLLAVSTPAATKAELHSMSMEGNVMRMRPVLDIPVPAHGSVALKPGGLHIMLMNLREPLKQGETFPLTLMFEKAGNVSVQVAIQGVGAMGPGTMPMGKPGMGSMPMGDHGSMPQH